MSIVRDSVKDWNHFQLMSMIREILYLDANVLSDVNSISDDEIVASSALLHPMLDLLSEDERRGARRASNRKKRGAHEPYPVHSEGECECVD